MRRSIVPRESDQLFSGAPRIDHEFRRIAGTEVDDPVFAVPCVDEPIADVIGKGIAREAECRPALDIAEAVTNRLDAAAAAKHVADLEHVASVSEVAEMVCRAQEDRALLIVGRERGAAHIENTDVELELAEEPPDIGPRRIRHGDLPEFGTDRIDRGDVHLDDPVRRVEADPRSRAHLSQPTRFLIERSSPFSSSL